MISIFHIDIIVGVFFWCFSCRRKSCVYDEIDLCWGYWMLILLCVLLWVWNWQPASASALGCGQPPLSGKVFIGVPVVAKTSSSKTSEVSQLLANLIWCDWPWRQNPLLALHRGRLKRIAWSCWNCGQREAVWWDYVAIWSILIQVLWSTIPIHIPFIFQFSECSWSNKLMTKN